MVAGRAENEALRATVGDDATRFLIGGPASASHDVRRATTPRVGFGMSRSRGLYIVFKPDRRAALVIPQVSTRNGPDNIASVEPA
jgi:hypothetical protein